MCETEVKGSPAPEAGKVWVRWFGPTAGSAAYAQVEPHELKTLSEGFEAHHRERQKGRK